MTTAQRLVDEFYDGTAEKDWPAWAIEAVAILERMPEMTSDLQAASSNILTGQAGLTDANACMRAADALGVAPSRYPTACTKDADGS